MAVTLNASTSTGYIQTADTSGDLALQSNGTTQFTVSSTGAYGQLKASTAVTVSGTSVDFTSIPSWVKRITVMLQGVSTNGTNTYQIQIGAGSMTTSGYASINTSAAGAGVGTTAYTSGFVVVLPSLATNVNSGAVRITNLTGNTWVVDGVVASTDSNRNNICAGSIALGGTLDRLRIIASATGSPSDTFDAGSINILYEG
jgi:hypothetical protein